MKSVKINKAIIILLLGMLLVICGSFFKITKIGSDVIYNIAMAIGVTLEIIAVYFIFRHFISSKKERV